MNGNENGMSCSRGITGAACIVVVVLLKFITNVMQKEISGKNRSSGLFRFVNLVMMHSIIERTIVLNMF